ncbi:MAG: hypothetical protein KatS3mg115_2178 [Candidatus Poribacteria bacterium]|nr:MAG: hypothetical protein KatS3mg115_2178 [Candidatus Poribacteria bacterium]
MWKRIAALVAIVSLGLGATAFAAAPKIGEYIDDFTLVNVHDNKPVSLSDFKDAKAVVLMFIATQCPVSNAYNERMVEIYKAFKDKGIQFVGINSNRQEPFEEVREHAQEHGFEFPVLKDVDNKIADVLDARVTPEIYVLEVVRPTSEQAHAHAEMGSHTHQDVPAAMHEGNGAPKFKLIYHGWIDDNQNPAKVTEHTLQDVLTAFLAGEPLPKTETKAFGCTIKRVKKGSPSATP